jgi:hypothetical protein
MPSSLGSGSDTHAAPPPTNRSSTPPRSGYRTEGTKPELDAATTCPLV